MDKNILKKIAKDWCKGILLANGGDSFTDIVDDGLLTEDEVDYILKETNKLAEKITKDDYISNLEDIIKKYYDI